MAAAEPGAVAIATQCYWPEPTGSAPVVAGLAEYLAAQGDAITVLTARPSYPSHVVFADWRGGQRDRERHRGVAIERVPGWPKPGGRFLIRLRHEGTLFFWQCLAALTGRVRRHRHVVSVSPSLLMVLVGHVLTARGGRHLCLVHDIQSGLAEALSLGGTGGGLALLRWLERAVLNRCDLLITLSEEMAGQLRRAGIAAPIEILPPQTDTEAIRPLPRPDDAPPTALYSGNLGHKQGLDQLVALGRRLAETMPEARLLIRGDGNALAGLKAQLRLAGIAETVTLEPLAPLDRLAEALSQGDVHLVPQRPEGADFAVPSKAFAIMAAGRPFVATAGKGSPLDRLARDSGGGVVVPPGDAEAFAEAVAALLSAPEEAAAMGARGRAWAETHASPEAVLGRTRALLFEDEGRQTSPALDKPAAPCDHPSASP